jgi:hypothetical protein
VSVADRILRKLLNEGELWRTRQKGSDELSDSPQSKATDIFRWIVFIPGAVLGAMLVGFLFAFVSLLCLYPFSPDPDSAFGRIGRALIDAQRHVIFGAAFVYLGAKIAPYNRKTVAYVLAGLGFLFTGFALFPAIFMFWNMPAIVGTVCMGIGTGIVVYEIHIGKIVL